MRYSPGWNLLSESSGNWHHFNALLSAILMMTVLIGSVVSCSSQNSAPVISATNNSYPRVQTSESAGKPEGGLPATYGLEIRWWVVDDESEKLSTTLLTLGKSEGLVSKEEEIKMRDNGFRLVRVPFSRFSLLQSRLEISKEITSDWLGQVPTWITVMSGPQLPEGQYVRIAGRERAIPAGWYDFRLRCWLVPTGGLPRLDVDLMPQFHRKARSGVKIPREISSSSPSGDITDAMINLQLERDYVYLLTAESPDILWSCTTEEISTGHVPGAVLKKQSSDADNIETGDKAGPRATSVPAVGELMMRPSDVAWLPGQGRRIVAVLIPRLPTGFSLLPALDN